MSRSIVFASAYVSWAGMQQRGGSFAQDRLTRRLLEDTTYDQVLLAEPFRHVARPVLQRLRHEAPAPLPAVPGRHRFAPARLRRGDPVDARALRRTYALYDRLLGLAVRRHGLGRPQVVTTHPLIAGFCRMDWAASVTFFCTDDWTAFYRREAWIPAYADAFTRFAASGRPLAAVSQPIVARIDPTGPARVVPNGLEAAEWLAPRARPAALDGIGSPLLLYVGTLDSRLDVASLLALVEDRPAATLVLVGPVGDEDAIAPLRAHRSVRVLPPVGRADLAATIAAADVCLVPHRRTRLTEAMSPLKLYEYLAAGKPVVATDLEPMRGVSSRVLLAAPDAPWAALVAEAEALGDQAEDERVAFLRENTWRARQDAILQLAG